MVLLCSTKTELSVNKRILRYFRFFKGLRGAQNIRYLTKYSQFVRIFGNFRICNSRIEYNSNKIFDSYSNIRTPLHATQHFIPLILDNFSLYKTVALSKLFCAHTPKWHDTCMQHSLCRAAKHNFQMYGVSKKCNGKYAGELCNVLNVCHLRDHWGHVLKGANYFLTRKVASKRQCDTYLLYVEMCKYQNFSKRIEPS